MTPDHPPTRQEVDSQAEHEGHERREANMWWHDGLLQILLTATFNIGLAGVHYPGIAKCNEGRQACDRKGVEVQ